MGGTWRCESESRVSTSARIKNMPRKKRMEARPEDSAERYHDLTHVQQAELLAWITEQHPQVLTGWFANSRRMLRSLLRG